MRTKMIAAAATLSALLNGVADAQIQPTVRVIPIDQSAVSGPGGDAVLEQFRTFDIQANYPTGDSFNVAGLYSNLSQGRFYSPELGGTFPVNEALLELYPALRYDTYITFPDYGTHQSYGTPGRLFGTGGPVMPNFGQQDSLINIVWGRHGAPIGPSGTLTIARLTVSIDANGVVQGDLRGHVNPTIRNQFTADIIAGEVVNLRAGIPEPSLGALAAIAFVGCAKRRRASH